ncbi:DUF6037 family protein [Bacillus thuringiensis]|jgi:transposase-like protein|uniref:DUF6037 family protein n=1 Tax=Bacillus thuringiensis TaxID=1428 RepID=UPI001580909F|nr:DUF6037 family protein [Bacillus thuringiensis]NUH91353.1 topoisomerase DNA-binding C4 zinc finger domain-containing protein [Bacillus thuringiensis]NUH96674.1 topoisomerase DNA-binding C4 zinc finger domain-containing protein [Bacillus thuringiensis]NUI02020.1 topoisomerase DNA-binding C4 zinc finger domain-containing protein [Bacillus thuringiensis]NUI07204.1 topoisomerase DNA-binding C4 zinc finger domain-containing protein [Bacillus thuringiensis]NUI15213.1 topoisomerase DNA-binding C4 
MDFKEALEHLDVICERQDTNRILFNFKFNEMKITGIYLSISKSILISCNNTNVGWVVEANENYNISTFIPKDIFGAISKFVLVEEEPGLPTTRVFFNKLKDHLMELPVEKVEIPTHKKFIETIGTTKTRDTKYDEKGQGEKIYFKTWSRHVVKKVSPLNLQKTRRWFGKKIYEFCKENNISSVWASKPSKNIELNFQFLDPTKAQEELNLKKNSCPKCKSQLVVRNGKNGPFLGCCEFPKCTHTENLKK